MDIWGIKNIEEMWLNGGELWWKFAMHHSFFYKGRPSVGINEKFILAAQNRGVKKFMVVIDGKENLIECPSVIKLKAMTKDKIYGDRESKFPGAPPMRIYYFGLAKEQKVNSNQTSLFNGSNNGTAIYQLLC